MELISFSEGPINFGRKTKKYLFKKVDLAAEIFSFQDYGQRTLNPLKEYVTSVAPKSRVASFSGTTGS